jgi:S1-C subfamily serine protease
MLQGKEKPVVVQNPNENWYVLKHCAEGMDEAAAWRTVGIIADKGTSIATGCAVSWNDTKLILTAHHVIRGNSPDELWFLFRTEGSIPRVDSPSGLRLSDAEFSIRRRVRIIRVMEDEDQDLAGLVVPNDLGSVVNLEFHQLDRTTRAPAVGTTVLTHGYPRALGRQVTAGGWAVFPSSEFSKVEPPVGLDKFNPARSFLIKYSSDSIPNPHGFSGAAVWFHKSTASVWHSNLELAGIVTSYYGTRRLLEAAKVEAVSAFLSRFLG